MAGAVPVPWPAAAARRTDGGSATSPATAGDFGVGGDGGGNAAAAAAAAGGRRRRRHRQPAAAAARATGPRAPGSRPGCASGDGLVTVNYGETCKGQAATIVAVPGLPTTGTDGNDVIVGTQEADVIDAGFGDDLICAGGGTRSGPRRRGRGDRVSGGGGAATG